MMELLKTLLAALAFGIFWLGWVFLPIESFLVCLAIFGFTVVAVNHKVLLANVFK